MSKEPSTREQRSADAAVRLVPGESGRHFTFCRLCEAFCGLAVDVSDGVMQKITPDRQNPHSLGHVCVKGTAALGLTYDPDRLTKPLRRIGAPGEFEPVDWEVALAEIAEKIADILRASGPDAVANYIGNPTAFSNGAQASIRPFLAHFGIWKMFSAATQDATARMMASYIAYGSAFRFPIPDLPRCEFLLILGANPLVSHGSALTAPRIREDIDAIANRGRVIVVDPRETETAQRYEHVPIIPDTDVWLLSAMLNVLFADGLIDENDLSTKASSIGALRRKIDGITPEIAEAHCGIPASRITELAHDFLNAPRAAAYCRTGICRGTFSTLAVMLVDALNLVCGKFGVLGGSVFGDSPIDLTRLRPSGFEMRATRFGPRPYIANNLHFSLLVDEILTPGEGKVRAFLMESGNIMLSAPGGAQIEKALSELELFVSHDLYINETNRYAHYILPGPTFLERADLPTIGFPHMVRPFAQFTDAVVPPLGESRDEHIVLNDLGSRLHDKLVKERGKSQYFHKHPPKFEPLDAIDSHMRDANTIVKVEQGSEVLSIDLLKRHPHGIVLAESLTCTNSWTKVMTKDAKIQLWHPLLDAEIEKMRGMQPPPKGQLRLFSMRTLQSLNSWLHNVERLTRSQKPLLLIHPQDADARGIVNGARARIISSISSIEVDVEVTSSVVRGAVCYPHGWGHRGGNWQRANMTGGANINLLADLYAGDQLSASALLDGIVVEIEPIAAATH